jgi:enamine deaminase RidA (YjgF/YER057c/UK114 family)
MLAELGEGENEGMSIEELPAKEEAGAESRLQALGLVLPAPAAPVAAYIPFVIVGRMVHVSGQLPIENGVIRYQGPVSAVRTDKTEEARGSVSLEEGVAAAWLCALNLLAQVRQAAGGNLDRVARCVKLTGYVQSEGAFRDHPKVINGASELMVAVLGERGRHARAAVGVASLPLGASVEVDGLFELY